MGRALRATRLKKGPYTKSVNLHNTNINSKSNILQVCTSNTRSDKIHGKKSSKESAERSVFADKTNESSHTSTYNSMSLRKRNMGRCLESKSTSLGGSFRNGIIQSPRTKSSGEKAILYSVRKLSFYKTSKVVLERLDEEVQKCAKEKMELSHKDCVYTNNSSPLCKASLKLPLKDRLALYEFEVDENEPCAKKKKKKKKQRKKKIVSDTSDDEPLSLGSVIKKLRHLETSSPACSQINMETCMAPLPIISNVRNIALSDEIATKQSHIGTKANSSLAGELSEISVIQDMTSGNKKNNTISNSCIENELKSNQCGRNMNDSVLPTAVLQEYCGNQDNIYEHVNSRRRFGRSPSLRLTKNLNINKGKMNCTESTSHISDKLYTSNNSKNKIVPQTNILSFLSSSQQEEQEGLGSEVSSIDSVASTSNQALCASTSKRHDNYEHPCTMPYLERNSHLSHVSGDVSYMNADLSVDNCFGFDEEPEDMLPFCSPVQYSNNAPGTKMNVTRAPFAVSSTPDFKVAVSKSYPTRLFPRHTECVSALCAAKKFHRQCRPGDNILVPSASSLLSVVTTSTSLPTMIQPTLHFLTENQRLKVRSPTETSPILFQDDIPVHFQKPPRKSYERQSKRKLINESLHNKSSEEEEEGRSVQKPKKKYSKRAKQEKRIVDKLTARFNSQFEEIDDFELCIE